MSTEMNEGMAKNPLVGKTLVITWETGLSLTVEHNFISDSQKTTTVEGNVATDDYEMAVVAPDIYMVTWKTSAGEEVVTVVANLKDRKAYGSHAGPQGRPLFMTGSIKEIR